MVVVHRSASGLLNERCMFNSCGSQFFSLVKFFVMDKERIMRVPKGRSYGAQPPVRASKVQSYGTCPSLHDRADTFASYQYFHLYDN